MLSTPYYTNILDVSPLYCERLVPRNYGAYDLFCLLTQLGTYLTKLGYVTKVTCVSVEEDGKMALKVQTSLVTPNSITLAQEKVTEIINNRPDYCLVYSSKLETKFPSTWVREMLPYINNVPKKFNPFIYEDDLYVDLSSESEYDKVYSNLIYHIRKLLKKRWRRGYVTYAAKIAKDWSLISVDEEGILFRPDWKDGRFAFDAAPFLLSRLEGNKYISLKLPPTLPIMHNVASLLQERNFYFVAQPLVGCYVFLRVENLHEAQALVDEIEEVAYSSVGVSYVENFSSLGEAEERELPFSVTYKNYGSMKPYVLSTIQGFNLPAPKLK